MSIANPPIYTRKFTTFRGTRISCLLRRGTPDFNTIQSIAVQNEYNLKAIPLNDGDVVLDLGAYIGGASLLLASINKSLRIHSYEPIPENVRLLKRNAKLNGFSNISAHQLAISDKKGKMKIYYGLRVHYFVGSWKPSSPEHRDRYVEVDTTTLEEIFSEHDIERCKLIKSDIEGNEAKILKSCPYDVLKRIDYFVGEHHGATRKELLSNTRGVFEDVPCRGQTDSTFGHFWFKNRRISE